MAEDAGGDKALPPEWRTPLPKKEKEKDFEVFITF